MNDEDQYEDPVAPNPPHGQGEDPISKCRTWINNYLENPLEIDREKAAAEAKVACLGYEEGKISTQIRVCRLRDAQRVRTEYRDIQNCVSTTVAAHAGGVSANVTSYLDKEKELSTKLDAALAAIQAVKGQIGKVHSLCCKLETARTDSCNSEQIKEIKKKLPADADDDAGLVRFNKETDAICDCAETANEKADDLVELGIKYSAIQATMNVTSLESLIKKLTDDATALATDVTDQAGVLDTKLTEHQTAVNAEIQELTTAIFGRKSTERASASLEMLHIELDIEIGNFNCEDLDKKNEEDNTPMEQLEAYCDQVISTFEETAACGDEDDNGNKFNTQDAPVSC